jgi:hypothetical protein
MVLVLELVTETVWIFHEVKVAVVDAVVESEDTLTIV